MTISDYLQKLKNVRQCLKDSRRNETILIILRIKALVQLRIQETGVDFLGEQFEEYTPKYAEQGRRELGYQSDYVDFTRTGEMWRNVKPVVSADGLFSTTVTLQATDQKNQDKINGQERKRGNILQPSEEENALANKMNENRILKCFKEIL